MSFLLWLHIIRHVLIAEPPLLDPMDGKVQELLADEVRERKATDLHIEAQARSGSTGRADFLIPSFLSKLIENDEIFFNKLFLSKQKMKIEIQSCSRRK